VTGGGPGAPDGPPPFPAPRTALYLHEAGSLHDTGWGHPDHQGRLRALVSAVGKDMLDLHGRVEALEPRNATLRELERVHPGPYLASIRGRVAEAEAAGQVLDFAPDTPVSAATWDALVGSSGAVLDAVEAVAEGRFATAFVGARPPGHRASADQAAGFCLVNHVAVGARHLQATGRAGRVAIVDWGVHHGSGTQEIFYDDPSVFYLSLHGPSGGRGTGDPSETGAGPGEGATMNVPLPLGADGARFRSALDRSLEGIAPRFAPDFVLISAGFDGLAADPLGGLRLAPGDYFDLARRVMDWADEHCEGRVVAVLEGGYDPPSTARAALATLRALAGLPRPSG
jgi:acetoin utilization deacetylase AcuC-like enzyme